MNNSIKMMRILAYTICLFIIMTIISIFIFFYVIIFNLLQTQSINSNAHTFTNFVKSLDTYSSYNTSEHEKTINSNALKNKIDLFRNQLIVKLRRSELQLSSALFKNKDSQNVYNVHFKGVKSSTIATKRLLCDVPVFLMRNVSIQVNRNSRTEHLIYENVALNKLVSPSETKPVCALVSNSGSMSASDLGKEINSHRIVMRFNNAPVIGYESDVGNETTIRILNSQLVLNDSYGVGSSTLYDNLIKLVWDTPHYNSDFKQWLSKRSQFFDAYIELTKKYSNEDIYLIHPQLIWKAWDLLQSTTFTSLPKNPPTSGFLGIIILLKICSKINIYEYIPSIRMSEKCHYYDQTINIGCTFGQWHPLPTEKLFIISINEGNVFDEVLKGKVTINGCNV